MSPHLLVLGLGNILMGDEGVGVHAVTSLDGNALPDQVTVVDGGTGGFHLLEYLQTHDRIVMVDAALDGHPVGTVSVLRPEYAWDFPRSLTAHDVGLRDLIEAAALLGPLPAIVLVTVSIAEITTMSTTLSAEIAGTLPKVHALIRDLVDEANADFGWSRSPATRGVTSSA